MSRYHKFLSAVNSLNTTTTDVLGFLTVLTIIVLKYHMGVPFPVWAMVFAWVYLPIFTGALVVRYRNRRKTP